MLGFDRLSKILHSVLNLSASIMFALVVMVVGDFIASTVFNAVSKKESSWFSASAMRFAIIGLFFAIA